VLLLLLALPGPIAAAQRLEIPEGSSNFQFVERIGPATRSMTVWTHRPRSMGPSTKIVFVMHGLNRDGRRYRNQWRSHAEQSGFLLLVPEFDAATFSTGAYQRGNLVTADGTPLPRDEWSFGIIERIFDAVRSGLRLRTASYSLYGHSAGAQFVHRFVLFMPESRCSLAIAANSGWYTLPDLEADFPYGLRGAPATEESLRRALGKNLIVLIGEEDTDSMDPNLRNTKRARAQGSTRLARAQTFYEAATAVSARLRAPLRWRYVPVRGAAHSNQQMSEAAIRFLR
jgi:hypothetical protein